MNTPSTRSLLALTLSLTTGLALAHGGGREHRPDWEDPDQSFDRARRATERGEILPIAEIYARAAARVPGRVLEVELEQEHGRWVYELKILDPEGRLMQVEMDARTGDFLKQKEED